MRKVFIFRNFLMVITLAFAILTFLAKQYRYFNFDLTITLFIQQFNFIWFDQLMKLLTFTGNIETLTILVFLLVIYLFFKGRKLDSMFLVFSVLGGVSLGYLFKLLIARPRPNPELIHQLGTFLKADSFPSGHVMATVSLYGFLLFIAFTQIKNNTVKQIIMGICIANIFLMGVSRIYLGAHWFSDVLGAYLLGFIWLSIVAYIYRLVR